LNPCRASDIFRPEDRRAASVLPPETAEGPMSDTPAAATARPDLVFDLGMHDGQDTDFYLRKGFRVVAVEANPALVAEAEARFARAIAQDRLTILNCAIADTETALEFYVNRHNSKWSSLEHRWGSRGARGFDRITVEGRRLEDIAAQHGVPHYLKIDIEGADMIALQAVRRFPARPGFVSVEGGGENFLKVFAELGFDRFCPVDQSRVPETTLCKPAREGRFVKHDFPLGASGPFGHDLPGPWVTFDEALDERRAFRDRIRALEQSAGGDATRALELRGEAGLGWYDMHATTAETLQAGSNPLEPPGVIGTLRARVGL
jgi:FkbM family methyltransferase